MSIHGTRRSFAERELDRVNAMLGDIDAGATEVGTRTHAVVDGALMPEDRVAVTPQLVANLQGQRTELQQRIEQAALAAHQPA